MQETTQVTPPLQIFEGIVDMGQFLLLRTFLPKVFDSFFSTLSFKPELNHIISSLNCHVIVEATVQAFPDFPLARKSGHFGLLNLDGEKIVQYEHSWIVSEDAPEWVVDVSPFNGAFTPIFVYASAPPWENMYREDKELHPFIDKDIVSSVADLMDSFVIKH